MTMLELMQKGGPLMWVLLAGSVAGTTVFLKKAFDLHRAQIKWSDFLRGIYNILNRRNIVEAVSICEETPGPVASLVRAAVLHYDEDHETIRRAIEEAGLVEIPRLERNLGLLATLAQTAPLIGVLGTVLGMIQVFSDVMLHGTGNAELLAGGISTALITTAAGLIIGIPIMVAYYFFKNRFSGIVAAINRACGNLLETLTVAGEEKEPAG